MLVLFLILGGGAWAWLDAVGGPTALRERHGALAALLLVPLQTLVSLTPIPGEVVVLFGFWWGTLAIWSAWMLTAFVQYAIFRRTAQDFDFEHAFARLPAWIRRFPVDHPVFLIFGRWLPYGAHLVNSAAGAFAVPLWRFTWCASIGIGAGALAMSALANGWTLF
jgi:uncharacterized membrane protein YdjX (TVP38/TMEM64 family)